MSHVVTDMESIKELVEIESRMVMPESGEIRREGVQAFDQCLQSFYYLTKN